MDAINQTNFDFLSVKSHAIVCGGENCVEWNFNIFSDVEENVERFIQNWCAASRDYHKPEEKPPAKINYVLIRNQSASERVRLV